MQMVSSALFFASTSPRRCASLHISKLSRTLASRPPRGLFFGGIVSQKFSVYAKESRISHVTHSSRTLHFVLMSLYFFSTCMSRTQVVSTWSVRVIALLCSPCCLTLRGTAAAARRWSERGEVLEIGLALRCGLLNVLGWYFSQALRT